MSTSNRRSAFTTPQSNPATKILSWKSNDKKFSYYDKESQTNVAVELPFKFLVIDELASVKGWSDALSGSIISNEVKFISKEPLKVKCYNKNLKGESASTIIANGIYKDIKAEVNSAGAKYHKSVYIMLEDGSLANIQMKGSVVKVWSEFTQKTKSRLTDEWVLVENAVDGKKGAVKFSTPSFKFDKSLSDSESAMADEVFNKLEAYLTTYLVKGKPAVNDIEVVNEEEVSDDDVDF